MIEFPNNKICDYFMDEVIDEKEESDDGEQN